MKISPISEDSCQTGVLEIRLPWTASTAWQSLLANMHVAEDCFLRSDSSLGMQAEEILPEQIVKALRGFVENADQYALVVRNCPIDRMLPPTPYSGRLSPAQSPVSCLAMLALYQLLGVSPIVYAGENDGELFRHVVPARRASFTKSSHGSRARFGYHVDNPDLPLSVEPLKDASSCPEYLSLFGMRCDPKVATTLVSAQRLLSRLDPDVLEILASPRFIFNRPASFSEPRETTNLPLIAKTAGGRWLCRFDTENTRAMDDAGHRAIDSLRKILETRELDTELLLMPGDFLIFKNQAVLHARDAFVPRDDGADRWLIRLFGVSNLARVRHANTGRNFEVSA